MTPGPEEAPRARRSRWRVALHASAALLILAFIALLAYGLATSAPDRGIDESLARNEPPEAPGFDLPILEAGALGPPLQTRLRPAFSDGRLTLGELRGTPVVLNFWASWCVPCRTEAPFLERTWREQRRRGVLVLGLNMQDLVPDATSFIREFNSTYPHVRDQSKDVAERWGVTGLPETFFITARGRIVAHVIGVVSKRQMAAGIAATRTGRPVGVVDGGAQRETR